MCAHAACARKFQAYFAGGATIATGAVMLYLNRGRTVYPSAMERLTPTVTPMPGGATLSFGGRF